MKWDMKKPCATCPFLKVGGIRLMTERIEEIAGGMLDSRGHIFPCHVTVDYGDREDSDDNSSYIPSAADKHCAGALIFAEKNGNTTQMMRISERIGFYDASKLMTDKEAVDSVFDTLDDMLESALERPVRKKAKVAHAKS